MNSEFNVPKLGMQAFMISNSVAFLNIYMGTWQLKKFVEKPNETVAESEHNEQEYWYIISRYFKLIMSYLDSLKFKSVTSNSKKLVSRNNLGFLQQ